MKILLIIINLSLAFGALNITGFIGQMIKEVKPRQISLYTDERNITNKYYGLIFKNLIEQVPTTAISLKNIPPYLKFTRGYFQYNNNISAPLHLIMLRESKDGQHMKQLYYLLRSIKDSLMYLTSTKICLLFFHSKNSIQINYQIFNMAWFYKYDDFTVLSIYRENQMSIFYHNYSSFKIEERYGNGNFKYFPEKIINLNGYPLRVGVNFYLWPNVYKETLNGLPVHLNPYLILFKSYEYFAAHLNVTSVIIPLKDLKVQNSIKDNNLELYLTVATTLRLWNYDYMFILGEQKLVVVVPIIHEIRAAVSTKIFDAFLSLSIIILLTRAAAKFYKFPKKEWKILNIFSYLLGYSVSIYPRNWKAKLIYIILAAFSLFYVSDIISDLTEINYISDKKLLIDSIEDAFEKNISVCKGVDDSTIESLIKDASEDVKKFVNLGKKKCALTPEYDKNMVEIYVQRNAEIKFYLSQYEYGENKFEVVDFNLPIQLATTCFALNSPFRKKFAEMHGKVYEFGLDKKWAENFKVTLRIDNNKNPDLASDSKKLVTVLSSLIVIGAVLGFASFFLEMIWKPLSKKINIKLCI